MNILLIAPHFYDYEIDIKKEIERQGNSVDLFYSIKEKYFLFTRFVSEVQKQHRNLEIQEEILREIKRKEKKYQLVLFINGGGV